jgi:hypothetical protein
MNLADIAGFFNAGFPPLSRRGSFVRMEKAMKQARVPFKRMVFVCTHQREGEAACANAGHGENRGDLLVELLREELKKRGVMEEDTSSGPRLKKVSS